MRGLAGKVALVTGAANGIGRAIAMRLAAEGCTIGIFDRDETGALDCAGQIQAQNGTNVAGEADSMRQALVSRINTCAANVPPGYVVTASISGNDVRLTAPAAQGSNPNGQVVARTGTGTLTNFVVGAMGSVQAGVSVNSVSTTVSNMSGGRDAVTGSITRR